MLNQPYACRICMGKSKKRCIICGHKAEKEPKQKKELSPEEKREDFLGSLYNSLRVHNMRSVGTIGLYKGEEVIVVDVEDDQLRIVILREYTNVPVTAIQYKTLSTGFSNFTLGTWKGEDVVVRETLPRGFVRIATYKQNILVPRAEVLNVHCPTVDAEILAKIGDPLAPGARAYIPHRKPKKNEC